MMEHPFIGHGPYYTIDRGTQVLVLAAQRLPLRRQPGRNRSDSASTSGCWHGCGACRVRQAGPPRPRTTRGRILVIAHVQLLVFLRGPDQDRLPAQPDLHVPGLAAVRVHRGRLPGRRRVAPAASAPPARAHEPTPAPGRNAASAGRMARWCWRWPCSPAIAFALATPARDRLARWPRVRGGRALDVEHGTYGTPDPAAAGLSHADRRRSTRCSAATCWRCGWSRRCSGPWSWRSIGARRRGAVRRARRAARRRLRGAPSRCSPSCPRPSTRRTRCCWRWCSRSALAFAPGRDDGRALGARRGPVRARGAGAPERRVPAARAARRPAGARRGAASACRPWCRRCCSASG